MNVIDVLLLAVFAFAVVDGVKRGFVASSFSLVVWSLAFVVAVALTRLLFTAYGNVGLEPGGTVRILVFSATLFIVAAWLVVGGRRFLIATRSRLTLHPTLVFADRWLGIVPSLARTAIGAAALLTAINLLPVLPLVRDAATNSVIASGLVSAVEAAEPPIAGLLGTGERPLFLSVIHGAEEQQLYFPDGAASTIDLDGEQELFELLNRERIAAGRGPLVPDVRLTVVARAHAQEMFDLRYLSHYSPRTGKPSDRLVARDIPFDFMGENVAYAPSASLAEQGFLRSSSHKANLLDPRFRSVGIGAVSVGVNGTLYVEVFSSN